MWQVYPNASYVARPETGSIHNRGAAVDVTLVTLKGDSVDMGTPFDYFGREAHQTFTDLPQKVLDNRMLLRQTMAQFGFMHISTEWWHYSYRGASGYPIADFPLCE